MKNEMVLSTKDLNEVGINTQLSSNDLVEVVAHDIYDKYMDTVLSLKEKGKLLNEKYKDLFYKELNKMRLSLNKYLLKETSFETVVADEYEEEYSEGDYESGLIMTFGKDQDYWYTMSLSKVYFEEKDKGTYVSTSNYSLPMPSFKEKNARVKLNISTGNKTDTQEIVLGKINGSIETTTKKSFTQIITVSTSRFLSLKEEVTAFNEEVKNTLSFLPKNGLLSVERFTREARVKMNKKIISGQSPEFRQKMSQLFNIKL